VATDALQVADSCIWDGSSLSGSQACTGSTPSAKAYREGISLSGGNFNVYLKAPSKLGSLTMTATVANWLKFNWKGGGNTDPTAVASFGLYKPSDQVIFFREVY
jgi:MSHA biogenesis protein MshQ